MLIDPSERDGVVELCKKDSVIRGSMNEICE